MSRLRRLRCDRGDVLFDGLLHTVGYLAAVALLCFELIAVGVNMVQLDELAGEAAREAARTLPATADTRVLQAVAERHVSDALLHRPEVTLEAVAVTAGSQVSVTLARPPRTAVLHRVRPLAERLPQQVTGRGRPPTM